MAHFEHLGVLGGLEASISAATHLEPKHAATVAAARALAAKIDAWNVIVEWALEDVAGSDARPKVPANDNTSLGTYSRYLEHLGLVVPVVKAGTGAKPAAEPEPAPAPATGAASISSLQDRFAKRTAR